MSTQRIDEHISLSREELIALLRGKTLRWQGKPNGGSTLFTATMTVTLGAEMTSAERSRVVDVLTRSVKGKHLDGWVHRPDGTSLPVPGSTAWIAFIATNADRIFVNDANGVPFALRDLAPERQAEVVEGWLVNGHTPLPATGAREALRMLDQADAERAAVEAPTHAGTSSLEVVSGFDSGPKGLGG